MNEWILLRAPTIIDMLGIGANITLTIFSAGPAFGTMEATATQCTTETNDSWYSEDEGNAARDAENHRRTWTHPCQPRARRARFDLSTIGALSSIAAH